MKSYNESSYKGYLFEVGVEYPKLLHELHNKLPFLPKSMKVTKYIKLVCNFYHKEKYAVT